MISTVSQEMRRRVSQYRNFIKENRWAPWIVVFSVFLSYGISLCGMRIGIDSDVNINGADEFMKSWNSIGRFSLVFTKTLLGLRELNPMLANLLMIGCMVLYGIFADFLFYVFSGNDKRMKLFYVIFPALFLTHPCFVQQYIFTVQAFEVALTMLLCLMSVFCISSWVFEGRRGYVIPGLFLMVWSFGSYQAFVPFYMGAALATYLLYYFFHNGKEKRFYLKAALREAGVFLVGYLLYTLAVKAVQLWQAGGLKGDYLNDQLLWSSNPISVCLGYIRYYMSEVLLGGTYFYRKTFLLFAVLFAIHLLYVWVRERRREYFLYAAASLALFLSPFFLAFYQGGSILMRSQLTLPFAAAFFGAAAVSFICTGRKAAAGPVTAVCLLLAVNQGTAASRALFSAQLTYEHDKMTAQQLVIRMQALDAALPGQKVAMIGQYHPQLPRPAVVRQETIGYSFFEWDSILPAGVSMRGIGFLNVLGFPFVAASEAEHAEARAYSLNMPSWPSEGSVQKCGDVVVIKFSDE